MNMFEQTMIGEIHIARDAIIRGQLNERKRTKWRDPSPVQLVVPASGCCSPGGSAYHGWIKGIDGINGDCGGGSAAGGCQGGSQAINLIIRQIIFCRQCEKLVAKIAA